MSQTTLGLATFDELIAEIGERCSDFVFHGRKALGEGDKEMKYAYRRRHKGGYASNIFLASQLLHELQQDLREDWEDPEPWEEF